MTSEPNPAPLPSWLKKSTDSQNFNSRAILDNLDTSHTHRPFRTMSTRSSGVRNQQQKDNHAEISRSQPDLRTDSNPATGRISDTIGDNYVSSEISKSRPSSRLNSGPLSGRKSGIRREISRPESSGVHVHSRPTSSRMSGIRGQLYSRQKSRLDGERNLLSSSSDPHLPTFLDAKTEEGDSTEVNSIEQERLHTAVLAKGRRALRLNVSGSDTCLVPSIGDEDDDVTTPTLSHAKPDLSSTHFDADCPRPHHLERQSVNQCLESISKFDHLHLGQMGSNIQGELHV